MSSARFNITIQLLAAIMLFSSTPVLSFSRGKEISLIVSVALSANLILEHVQILTAYVSKVGRASTCAPSLVKVSSNYHMNFSTLLSNYSYHQPVAYGDDRKG